jgi:methionyl-tRNA formyltransferase
MKIVFWGSSDFSMPALELLKQKHQVVCVITNPDAACGRGLKELRQTPVKIFALKHSIPVLQPENIKDEGFYQELAGFQADLYITASYGVIIPERILNIPKHRSINLHASLLPKYRGASPIQAALENGDQVTGVTVQYMAKKMDAGDIILKREVAVRPDDHYPGLSERLAAEGADLLLEAVSEIDSGRVKGEQQDESKVTYAHLIKRENGKISFIANTAMEIYNKWKAFDQWPGIYLEYSNRHSCEENNMSICVLHLTDVQIEDREGEPGMILGSDKNGLIIACKKKALKINKLKPAGKNEMDYISFVNGYKPVTGRYF